MEWKIIWIFIMLEAILFQFLIIMHEKSFSTFVPENHATIPFINCLLLFKLSVSKIHLISILSLLVSHTTIFFFLSLTCYEVGQIEPSLGVRAREKGTTMSLTCGSFGNFLSMYILQDPLPSPKYQMNNSQFLV